MKLSCYLNGRDNNLNLIRIVAALAVLVTHSFALFYGTGEAEPLRKLLGLTIGTIAVDVFFITSGFLVTASLLKNQNVLEFIWARFLRIYPGLFVMLVATALVIAPIVSTQKIEAYFLSKELWFYMIKGMTILKGFSYNLPGVFESNPYKNAVNGSLWTLRYEVYMYILLACAWIVLKPFRNLRIILFKWILCISFISSALYLFSRLFLIKGSATFELHSELPFVSFLYMFSLGSFFYIFRNKIYISYVLMALSLLLMSIAMSQKQLFMTAYLVTLPFILFTLAFIPKGVIRKYNKVGDYSYGVYIYAFFIQQLLIGLFTGISLFQVVLFSAGISLVLAILSWHLVENVALDLRQKCVRFTKEKFQFLIGNTL